MAKAKAKQNSVRADGRVKVSLDVGRATGGKRTRKYFYGRTMDEAVEKRDAYMAAHPPEAPAEWRDATVSQWAERWLLVYCSGLADSTQASRKSAINNITAFDNYGKQFGQMKLADVRQSDAQAVLSSRAGRSRSDISLHKDYLVAIFGSAVDDDIIRKSPCEKLKRPAKGVYVGHRALTDAEQSYVNTAAGMHRYGKSVMLMMYAGLRREEMAALRWEDVDMAGETLHVRRAAAMRRAGKVKTTKSDAGVRDIPIVAPLYKMMDTVPLSERKGLVCTNANGGPLSETANRQAIKSFALVCERIANGLRPYDSTKGWRRDKAIESTDDYKTVEFTAHDLRYTYATMLYEAGVDVKTAAYLLGHADVTMTMKIYTQLTDKKKNASIELLRRHFMTDPQADPQGTQ